MPSEHTFLFCDLVGFTAHTVAPRERTGGRLSGRLGSIERLFIPTAGSPA